MRAAMWSASCPLFAVPLAGTCARIRPSDWAIASPAPERLLLDTAASAALLAETDGFCLA